MEADQTRPEWPDRLPSGPTIERDKVMADNVQKLLDQDPNNKVIFWVGSLHLNRTDNPNHKTAADILKSRTSMATVSSAFDFYRHDSLYPLPEITAGVKSPVAVATDKATTLGSLPDSRFDQDVHQRDWDYFIIYPSSRH